MKIPLKITFRDMAPSPAIEDNIREKADKLDALYDGIMGCRVIVEAPHRHHRKGKSYVVRIDMTVPGGELVVNREPKRLVAARPAGSEELEKNLAESHEPTKHAAHEDVYVAIRDAFNAASRKLQDYARRRRGKIKVHEATPLARVAKLFPIEDYGFLQTADGREIYFHKNSVLSPGFDRLEVGTEVYYAEELGEKGPQASTVRVTGQ
ncbi:MAG TPA: HPF/RaiA family ribosome-associated protein [Terriglobales bacterium]|jgi:cold shock CspA family protein|nr:HPF/RaiA family ribosome-associated protein [Terriglobales bacterium]